MVQASLLEADNRNREIKEKRLRKEQAKKHWLEDGIARPTATELHLPRPDAAAQRQDLHEAAGDGANVTGHVWLDRINWLSTTCGQPASFVQWSVATLRATPTLS